MKARLKYPLNGKVIYITVDRIDDMPNFVCCDKFHYIEIKGERVRMDSKANEDVFFADLDVQVSYLTAMSFTLENFSDGIHYACLRHITKLGTIYLSDLWKYINASMFVLEATNGKYHNLYDTEDEAIELRTILELNARHSLKGQLLLSKKIPVPVGQYEFILESHN